eukprot:SAG31_NODE_18510_length_633_cov_1.260300_1_plen_198_part_10
MIASTAPEHERGYWNGLNSFVASVAETTATLVMAHVYDTVLADAEDKSTTSDAARGKTILTITVGISILATICYFPLIALIPKPIDEDDQKKYHTVEEYEAMDDKQRMQLTMEERSEIEMKMMHDGKMPPPMFWGKYSDQRADLEGLMQRARADFKYMKNWVVTQLTSREKLEKLRTDWKQAEEWNKEHVDMDKARAE